MKLRKAGKVYTNGLALGEEMSRVIQSYGEGEEEKMGSVLKGYITTIKTLPPFALPKATL